MSQTPSDNVELTPDHPYAQAAKQLNGLIRRGRSFSGHERNCCFLNLGSGRFANASAVSGLDFPKDGRAIANVDWDLDGDVDLWIANRTAPQLQFLRNDLATSHHFLAFKLVGTQSNRDAIGAVVQLQLPDGTVLSKGLRAGEGYLAQSSKWLHFGLGTHQQIQALTVRWPNGGTQTFEVLDGVDRFLVLNEGGEVEPWQAPDTSALAVNSRADAVPSGLATRNRLTTPTPLPPLRYQTLDGMNVDATQRNGRPLVLTLWATWCGTCQIELAKWAAEADRLKDRADIVGVSVDSASEPSPDERQQIAAWLKRIAWPYQSGAASSRLVDTLQHVHDAIYDHHLSLPVPTTLLLGGDGRLLALYKGPVDVDTLLSDLDFGELSPEARMVEGLPFAGTWIGHVGPFKAARLAGWLWDLGYADEALALTSRLDGDLYAGERAKADYLAFENLVDAGSLQDAVSVLQTRLKEDPDDAESLFRLGTLLSRQGRHGEAAKLLGRAAQLSPTPNRLINLGACLRQLGQLDAAADQLMRALATDSRIVEAHSNLGLVRVKQSRFADAARHFQQAVVIDPKNVSHRVNLALALMNSRRSEEAIEHLRLAIEQDPTSLVAKIYLGEVLAQTGNLTGARESFLEVVQQQPDATRVWLRLAHLHERLGDYDEALACYERVQQASPGDPRLLSRMAWILATAPQAELRNGDRAVDLAEQSVNKTNRRAVEPLDALAAAYAEQGRFADAERVAREALSRIPSNGSTRATEQRAAIEARLQGYLSRVAFRAN